MWSAFFAILVITLVYLGVIALTSTIPAAGQFFGHSLGVIGIVLMLMTEVLYTLRKHSRLSRWGKMSSWLQFHIFTGLVGPYLVLLHTAWKFNGLAGISLLLTLVIVISGFIGRYIYTAVPRTVDGVEIEGGDLEKQIAAAGKELDSWISSQAPATKEIMQQMISSATIVQSGSALILGRILTNWELQRQWRKEISHMDLASRSQAQSLEKLLKRQVELKRQMASLGMARRLLSVWHTVHIPIGMALFTAAFLHVIGALYYATFIH